MSKKRVAPISAFKKEVRAHLTVNLKALLERRDVSVPELSKATGVGYIQLWRSVTGENVLSTPAALKVAAYFGTTVDELCGQRAPNEVRSLSREEETLIKVYRSTDSQGRYAIESVADLARFTQRGVQLGP